MDKTSIKNFSITARKLLIQLVKDKATLIGFTKGGIKEPEPSSTQDIQFFSYPGGKTPYSLNKKGIEQRKVLIDLVRHKEKFNDKYETIYESIIEEVAYTWFNRLIAIRFMEVNCFLPSGVRVLSGDDGKTEPEIVARPFDTDMQFTEEERNKISELKAANRQDELFGMLFIKQCNTLNSVLPGLFERINDYTELLLNISFTDTDGVVSKLINYISESDFKEAVEIVGWLYQYYNTELKDDVFEALKTKNTKISKEKIPAATQLFTPDWIVRYMVENSLGRLWLEGHPNDSLKGKWKYYLDEAEQTPEVTEQLKVIREDRKGLTPEDITFMDPCMGSGHILVYAFEVLMQIYESIGYTQKDAAKLILEKNLYGLDIDKRAYQLAYFALMMCARKHDKKFFESKISPQVYHPQGYREGENYGSLIKVHEKMLARPEMNVEIISAHSEYETELRIWNFKRLLMTKYDVVCTNPPYMGGNGMNPSLLSFVKSHYPDSKSDLFAAFIERCIDFTKQKKYTVMITQHSWMFIMSYEKLREKLILTNDIVNMAHLGAKAFEEIIGEVVQTTAFVMRRSNIENYSSTYARLITYNSQQAKEEAFLKKENTYVAKKENLKKIPGMPIAYWISKKLLGLFKDRKLLGDSIRFREGIHTADNARFLRLWWEPDFKLFVKNASNYDELDNRGRWVPYNKGGTFRRWYGNNEYAIGFDAKYRSEMAKLEGRVWPSQDMYFKSGGTWTAITTGNLGVRFYPDGFLFDAGGQVLQGERIIDVIALLNTVLIQKLADIMMPTINYKCGILRLLPDLRTNNDNISKIAQNNIEISREDWDSSETSWDFKRHPLIPPREADR